MASPKPAKALRPLDPHLEEAFNVRLIVWSAFAIGDNSPETGLFCD